MSRFSLILCLLIAIAITAIADETSHQAPLEIVYIANEGVLISSGDKRVLIDGDGLQRSARPLISSSA